MIASAESRVILHKYDVGDKLDRVVRVVTEPVIDLFCLMYDLVGWAEFELLIGVQDPWGHIMGKRFIIYAQECV